MSSIDLNIIQRGAASNFEWTAGPGRITAANLGSIGETRTDNGGALNALPTPFARFYIFKEAFRRILDERNNPSKAAGTAYERLVSNCLDVFELLYNKKYHENIWKNSGRKLLIKEWNLEEDLVTLKRSVPILGGAIESYFKDDLHENRLFFVILEEDGKEYLLATSSPFTGFITPPDLDVKEVRDLSKGGLAKEIKFSESYRGLEIKPLLRKNGSKYFKDIELFEQRPAEFKNYMYTILFGNGGTISDDYLEIRDYIQSFKNDPEIKNNWEPGKLEEIFTVDTNAIIVNGISIRTSKDLESINYFSDTIIKVPYKLASDKFKTLTYVNDKETRSYDYLIPLSSQAISILSDTDFQIQCKEKQNGDSLEIELTHAGKKFTKKYKLLTSALKQEEGVIIPLTTAKVNLDLALFPNVLSAKESENNYFKVLVSAFDNNDRRTFDIDNIALDFYKKENGVFLQIETATDNSFNSGVRKAVVRSQQGVRSECGTKFYEIFNSSFDLIQATVNIDDKECQFTLIPIWDRAVITNKDFVYAVDLGTSNTYISRREKGEMKKPQQLTMTIPIVSYLHQKTGSLQKNQVTCWEDATPVEFKSAFKTEFVPPYIDGDAYKFPIRTALCLTGDDSSKLSLFDNSNIAFSFEKFKVSDNQKIVTDIKWSSDENTLRVFVRELLLVIKADILQENGLISRTNLIWFRPLSFKDSEKVKFESIWNEEAKCILCLDDIKEQISCYTESEAPYYYFDKEDTFKTVESVAIVDIGGGSTDFVYYQNGEPKIANSVHFGCDILWGNAYDKFSTSRKNGIYNKYKGTISLENEELKIINSVMTNPNNSDYTTKDIINFWISNERETKISSKLRADFPFVFAYHFTATIYYLASMLKANGLSYPRTITFSGNGSRYIDNYLTPTKELLLEITQLIVSKVYDKEINDIQLVLPEVRKEATCYGGLYHETSTSEPKPVIYYGSGSNISCKDVEELEKQFNKNLKAEVKSEVDKMHSIFIEVLSLLYRTKVVDGSKVKREVIAGIINDGVLDVLESKFQTEILKVYSKPEQYNDTLFFIPVVNNILNLTNYKAE